MKLFAVLTLAISGAAAATLPEDFSSGSSLAARDNGRTHIGYRATKVDDVNNVRNHGGVLQMPIKPGARQLGAGIYISPLFHDWPPAGSSDDADKYWDCRVTADIGFWASLHKAWVPRYLHVTDAPGLILQKSNNKRTCDLPPTLWGMLPVPKNINRPAYLRYLDSSFTPDNTVVFSFIQDVTPIKTQALLPKGIVDQGKMYLEDCKHRFAPDNGNLNTGPVEWAVDSLPGRYLGTDQA